MPDKQKQKVPTLRFHEFSGKWEDDDFENVFFTVPTKNHQIKNTEICREGGYTVVDQGKKKIAGFSNEMEKLFTDVPVIIFGDHTTSLKYIDFEFVIGADGTKIIKNRKENLMYLFYFLQANPVPSEGYKRHFSILKQLNIRFPALGDEQQKIASFLTAVDEKIRQLTEKKALLEEYKRGVIQQIFSQKVRFRNDNGKPFPEWEKNTISNLVKRINKRVQVKTQDIYREIGIRSHGKGLFHKEPVTGKSLGNKRVFWVFPNLFVVNIVFGWEQAVAKTTEKENGMIASHRFPMYEPIEEKLITDFLLTFFLTKKGKHLLGLASPGGAGRNKTLGQKAFEKLIIKVPSVLEQQKIVDFLAAIDKKIEAVQNQLTLAQEFKKGLSQQMFV